MTSISSFDIERYKKHRNRKKELSAFQAGLEFVLSDTVGFAQFQFAQFHYAQPTYEAARLDNLYFFRHQLIPRKDHKKKLRKNRKGVAGFAWYIFLAL